MFRWHAPATGGLDARPWPCTTSDPNPARLPVKIVSIETLVREPVAVVRVRTDDGVEGIGQTAPYAAEMTSQVLHSMVARFFLGRDPWDVETLVENCLQTYYKFPSTFLYRALAGLDTAVWDILGRATGQPVSKLLGGHVRDSIPVYASSMRRDIGPDEEAARLLEHIETDGFEAVKIRVGSAMGRDRDVAVRRTERIIARVRDKLGENIAISADANGGFTAARAIRVGRMLEDYAYHHFEEPCPYAQLEQTAQVTAALDIAVSGGEQDNSLSQFNRMIAGRVVDIVQPDIGYLGGISRARKVAVLAEAAGIPCTPHCANDSLLQVFTLHLAVAMPACSQAQEWSIEETPWSRNIYHPLPTVVDGRVAAPTGPGWGVSLDPDFVTTAERRVSRLTA
ncbi:mandelate racemase/muconate lactonizing enzyme family protein [Nocardia canadensis]|uniref:mandelate racemase/muconate lactonizing enzyme family protein n=1 Tax=Nocardia canadensis TaxID=3065238 RepID=UPI00292FD52D|nr:mandelate racemase/muconate lactonizing enzyme family protein [Nocardia canadensis]